MKIAIIGSGIAGNTLVWQLQHRHDLTIFEARNHLGGHTHTHELEVEGRAVNVDSGFIVFNEKTYPNFIDMLAKLGVEKQKTEMSFSVHCEATGFEYAGSNLNSLFAQRSNLFKPGFYRLIQDILRFNRQAPQLLSHYRDSITLGEYLRDEKYSDIFCRYYILPMGAAIWSQDVDAMLDFPACFFIRFFLNHGLLSINDRPQWYVVKGGSKTYVEKIYRDFRGQIYLNTPVTAVRRHQQGVDVVSRRGCERFDALFFACHSNQALALLDNASAAENAVLAALPYRKNSALLHFGNVYLPKRKLARSSWNYRIPSGTSAATVTYDMNRLQSLPVSRDICVTLNATDARVTDENIVAEMTYEHPVFSLEGVAAQGRHSDINGAGRTFYCGAYWGNGFHEDGVVSALKAIEDFNLWERRHENLPVYRTG
ncbi:MAG: NAD(P)/FAD-dependent oxidoreductase [Porticoccaceae bacterium]